MILTALNNYYDRLTEQGHPDISPYGFSQEKISYALVINPKGELLDVMDLRDTSSKQPRPSVYLVPNAPKRSVNIAPCFLWDKTGYVLGLTGSAAQKDLDRTAKTHEAFKAYHHEWIGDNADEGLQALLAFLDNWNLRQDPRNSLIKDEMLDSNVFFRLDGDRCFIHERVAAKAIRAKQVAGNTGSKQICLVTGEWSAVADLHPAIKGVNGAQTAGASIVSFNKDAFTSHGKKQGMNAPVSEKATFAYTTALNHLLRRDDKNHQRVNIGDTTVVFWAEADTEQQAQAGENLLASLFSGSPAPTQDSKKIEMDSDKAEISKLNTAFAQIAQGRPLEEIGADLKPDTRIYVLGLAPNAARLSVRFWETNTLDQFAKRLAQHYQDMLMEPLPWKTEPSIWRLINETVPHRKGARPKQDDASPQLAGELARAILTGLRYPQSLLANLIMRFRADGDISSLRVALCKAVLVRNDRLSTGQISLDHKEMLVSIKRDSKDVAYNLGRLFALLESAQYAALKKTNAPIRDKYFASASSSPAGVFPTLIRNVQNHMAKVRKTKEGLAKKIETDFENIFINIDEIDFPKSFTIKQQGTFAIGYYHQRADLFASHKSEIEEEVSEEHSQEETTEGDA